MLKLVCGVFFLMLVSNKLGWWESVKVVVVMTLMLLFMVPLDEFYSMVGSIGYIDTISFSLSYLVLWLMILMAMASNMVLGLRVLDFWYFCLMVSLSIVLVMSFFTNNMMMFYFLFEVSLIPTLVIITGWGYQPERMQAGVYLMLYTLTASLPLLVGLFYVYGKMGSLYLLWLGVGYTGGGLISLSGLLLGAVMILAFLVKMPMFLTHLWLPKAHVEAPVAGSMILAGVLLKLGGYGICRVYSKVIVSVKFMGSYIVALSILGMCYVGFMCMRLNDMKALVAYSSVSHMGLILIGLISGYLWGMTGGLAMMISHGLSSSGLFCIVNMYYERTSSRSFYVSKGLMGILPILCLMMFLLCGANISAPPTINLLSEIFLMVSGLKYDYLMVVGFPIGAFLGAVFTLFLFSVSQHGKSFSGGLSLIGVKTSEIHVLVLHLLPLNFIVLKSEIFFMWL